MVSATHAENAFLKPYAQNLRTTMASLPQTTADRYRADSMKPKRQAMMKLALERLPKAEVMQVFKMIEDGNKKANEPIPAPPSYEELARGIVFNRYCNRLCNHCRTGARVFAKLSLCEKCYATWYCSVDCQRKDWAAHKRWCNQPDAEPDTGPLAVAVLKTPDPVAQRESERLAEFEEFKRILQSQPGKAFKIFSSTTGKWRTMKT